ncbi:virginiamycin B lyase family protein [Candidatus Nitrosotenuis cloacae]|uniref:Copper resistance protein CopD n=1 Tax=Candidatus Nitrosotenuis cloacae TaxID=1603555 RepID=A0A3G1B2D4_9ARCH|nr:CopD family protein [Candidatus Nitrosotenuis cloacae]AJZ75903.1 copper resistance protein CopD [Candidatus Nitrosotenuis cloacae]
MKKVLAVFLLIFVSAIPLAYAHPLIIDSSPGASTNVGAGITQVRIDFSESVDLDFSYIKIFDSNGNQIDNKNTQYLQADNESILVVTTPPLQDGVYTVSTKVLSKIDGHLVPYAFVFGVGDVELPPPPQVTIDQEIYFPEAAARFPGIVGQVIVLGAAISTLLIWRGAKNKTWIKENSEFQKFFHAKFSTITGIALFAVFASNILMLAIQTIRLQVSASDVIETSFGMVWLIRMGLTVILLAVWFLLENKSAASTKKQLLVLGLSLILIGTTTAIGHGAASEQIYAIIIDYIHNLIASVWIGGIIFFGFVLLPAFTKLDDSKKELASLLMIPRFSSVIIVSLGIVIITGPTLLWLLEDDVSLLSQSYYGLMIIAKIAIGSAMVALGGYNQFRIQRMAEKSLNSGITVQKKLKRSLRTEAVLGIVLLGIVALLTNSSLPASQGEEAKSQIPDGFNTLAFSESSKFAISITPLKSGTNKIFVSAQDSEGNPLDDIAEIKAKVSNPQKNIPPIEIPLVRSGDKYEGEITFGFSGSWSIEIDTQRQNNPNESAGFVVMVKPRLSELKTDITEYTLPESAAPLYPVYDGDDTIWISDSSKPRLWKFSISEKQFTSYTFEGKTTVFLKLDGDRVWFADTPDSKIGYFDIKTEQFHTIPLPIKSLPISLETDNDGNLWIALVDQNMLLKYDIQSEEFQEYKIPTNPSGPVALVRDQNGMIWFAESQGGKIGVINPSTGIIKEFMSTEPLKEPFFLFIDQDGTILVSEHTALKVIRFNPYLETFSHVVTVTDANSLPFALAPDKFGNIWIAQHTVDRLGIYDVQKREFAELNIPTQTTFTQFLINDKNGNIWFVEQRSNKLGNVIISEIPQISATAQPEVEIRYSELVSPLISAGIIATSLFFVKSIKDKRRIDSLID